MVGGQFSNLAASQPMANAGVGGFVLFGQPVAGTASAIRSGIAALDAGAADRGQVVPWVSTDEEGGPVARLSGVIGALPSARQLDINKPKSARFLGVSKNLTCGKRHCWFYH